MSIWWNRGFLPHLRQMSGNAAKLYLFLHLNARRPKRAVEMSFDDMARGNGWSLKTLQRTIEELEAKPYIEVKRATGQHSLTRIVLIPIGEQSDSAVDKSDHTSQKDFDGALDRFDHTSDRTSREVADGAMDISDHSSDRTPLGAMDKSDHGLPPNLLVELGIIALPDRHKDFVELAEATPRIAGETIVQCAARMMCACNKQNIWFPRPVYARVLEAAA